MKILNPKQTKEELERIRIAKLFDQITKGWVSFAFTNPSSSLHIYSPNKQ